MSTFQRIVPVKLIAGKEYVLRNGEHVYVKDNPHWQCAAKFPFFVMQGPDFIVYFTPEGQADPAGGKNEYDIIRPVYKVGETYIDRGGNRRLIDLDDNDDMYPLEDALRDKSWTRDGRMTAHALHESVCDLMDYAPSLPVPKPVDPADPWIGKRVFFNADGREGYGVVHAIHDPGDGYYTIKVDEPCTWGHDGDCDLGRRGWIAHVNNLRLEDAPTIQTIVHDVSPDLPILVTPVTPSRVGMRVEVQLDCATTVQATIMHEDAAHVAIEFDPGYYHAGAWTCDGHVPSGRGWYVPKDSVRAVSEAQVEAERSEAEALNEVDVAEVWAAYRINPSISIDAWIAARRQLKAAAK